MGGALNQFGPVTDWGGQQELTWETGKSMLLQTWATRKSMLLPAVAGYESKFLLPDPTYGRSTEPILVCHWLRWAARAALANRYSRQEQFSCCQPNLSGAISTLRGDGKPQILLWKGGAGSKRTALTNWGGWQEQLFPLTPVGERPKFFQRSSFRVGQHQEHALAPFPLGWEHVLSASLSWQELAGRYGKKNLTGL